MVDAVRSRVWVVQSGPLFPATGGAGLKDVIVRTAPLADWPSGFVIVTVFIPLVAPVVSRLNVTCVGLFHVTLLTATPETVEAIRLRQGSLERLCGVSKNPDPADKVPVMTTLAAGWPATTVDGLAETGVAGGGALSCANRVPYWLATLVYSWIVQIDWSSHGSRLVNE